MPCTCGSTSHARTNHTSCPLNKSKHQTVENAAAVGAGGDALMEAPVAVSEWEFHDLRNRMGDCQLDTLLLKQFI